MNDPLLVEAIEAAKQYRTHWRLNDPLHGSSFDRWTKARQAMEGTQFGSIFYTWKNPHLQEEAWANAEWLFVPSTAPAPNPLAFGAMMYRKSAQASARMAEEFERLNRVGGKEFAAWQNLKTEIAVADRMGRSAMTHHKKMLKAAEAYPDVPADILGSSAVWAMFYEEVTIGLMATLCRTKEYY